MPVCFCRSSSVREILLSFISLMSIVLCNVRRRMEREKIGLCGVPDVWGRVQKEEHPEE